MGIRRFLSVVNILNANRFDANRLYSYTTRFLVFVQVCISQQAYATGGPQYGQGSTHPKVKAHNTSAIPFTLQYNTTNSVRLQDDLQWAIPCCCHTSTNILSCTPMSSPIAYILPKTYACKLWDTAELLNSYICWRSSVNAYLEVPVQRSFIFYSKVIVVWLYNPVQTDIVCS